MEALTNPEDRDAETKFEKNHQLFSGAAGETYIESKGGAEQQYERGQGQQNMSQTRADAGKTFAVALRRLRQVKAQLHNRCDSSISVASRSISSIELAVVAAPDYRVVRRLWR